MLVALALAFPLFKKFTYPPAQASLQSAPLHIVSLPYYTTQGGWESTLTLNNAVEEPLTVSLKLYALDGTPLSLPDQTLRPLEHVSLRLAELIAQTDQSRGFREGSLALSFHHELGMALGPQLTMTDASGRLSVDMEPFMGQQSNRLEGLWWLPNKETDARVALANTLDQPLTVQMNLDLQGEQAPCPPIRLAPHQTAVMSLDDILKSANAHAAHVSQGGLSITHNGPIGALIAHGFIINRKGRFAANLSFVDPKAQHTSLPNV